jgi:formate hydrogenlyase subunit 4
VSLSDQLFKFALSSAFTWSRSALHTFNMARKSSRPGAPIRSPRFSALAIWFRLRAMAPSSATVLFNVKSSSLGNGGRLRRWERASTGK